MSSAHDAHDVFTGEPVNELPPDEPRTPGWLPVLGIFLFTAFAVVLAAGRESGGAPASATAAPATAAPAALPPSAPAAVVRPGASARPPGPPPTSPTGAAGVRPLGPDAAERIRQLRERGAPVGH